MFWSVVLLAHIVSVSSRTSHVTSIVRVRRQRVIVSCSIFIRVPYYFLLFAHATRWSTYWLTGWWWHYRHSWRTASLWSTCRLTCWHRRWRWRRWWWWWNIIGRWWCWSRSRHATSWCTLWTATRHRHSHWWRCRWCATISSLTLSRAWTSVLWFSD